MKNLKYLWIGVLATLLISCNDSASFETPHPFDGETLESIPENLRGRYIDEDSIEMLVKEFTVADMIKIDEVIAVDTDSLKELFEKEDVVVLEQKEDAVLVELFDGFEQEIRIENDSAYLDFEIPDEVFSMKDGDRIIKAGNSYYLNLAKSNGSFKIRKATPVENGLLLEKLVSADSLRTLLSIPEDSTLLNLAISSAQFNLLQKVGFREARRFKKMSE